MNYILIASRITLIGVSIFGVYSLCELLKPQFENTGQYILTFIVILIFVFTSIIDWGVKTIAKK